jgi:V/A-type H+-transporting ATPase subunit K
MDLWVYLGDFGAVAVLGIAGVGSAMGCGTAGMAAIGAWKKCYLQNKAAPFLLTAFVGAPLTQTIYAFILMNTKFLVAETTPQNYMLKLGAGICGGLAIGASAYYQGKGAAAACDAFAETGKGFANNLIALGITETVAVFVLAFLIIVKM